MPKQLLSWEWGLFFLGCCYLAYRETRPHVARLCTKCIPELEVLDERERESVWESAHAMREWSNRAIMLVVVAITLYPMRYTFVRILGISDPMVRDTFIGAMLTVLMIGGPVVNHFCGRKLLRRLIRSEINCLGIPMCMSCGHCLAGTDATVCSECGAIHPVDLCYKCDGVGSFSRRDLLVSGLVCLAAWGILMLDGLCAIPWVLPLPRQALKFMFARAQFCVPGAVFVFLYFYGGAKACCTRCGGTGKYPQQVWKRVLQTKCS